MDLLKKNKEFNLILFVYIVLLQFVFFKSIFDPFFLARQILTSVVLLGITFLLFFKYKSISFIRIDITHLFFLGFVSFSLMSFSKSQTLDLSHATLSRYFLFFIFFILLKHLIINDLVKISKLQIYTIIFGILAILITIISFTNKSINGLNLTVEVNKVTSTFGNKNLLSSILFTCLPFYFIGFSLSKRIKILSITAIIFTIILIILLRTRTVMIALFFYLFFILFYYLKNKFSRKLFIQFLLIFISIISIISYYFFSVKSEFGPSSNKIIHYIYRTFSLDTFFSRLGFWQQAIYCIKDNLFNGIGVGNWIVTYPKYGLENFSDINIQNGRILVNNPHNDFLTVLVEIGIFGFLCYLGIFISILYQSYWLLKNEISSNELKNSSYFLFFIFCYFIIAFFDFPLSMIEHQIILLIVFSIISSKYLKANPQKGFKLSSNLIYVFSFLLLTYSLTVQYNVLNGEKHLFKALEAEKNLDGESAILEFNQAKSNFLCVDNLGMPLEWHIGKVQFNQENYKESLHSFNKAHLVNPYSIVVKNDLASANIKNNRIREGIELYKEALIISPHYEDARINLAATYYNVNKFEDAFNTIDKCETNSINDSYKKFLIPIVEKKLNITLIKINNPELNKQLSSKIKTEEDLLSLYLEYKKDSLTFDNYIHSLIH